MFGLSYLMLGESGWTLAAVGDSSPAQGISLIKHRAS